VLKVKLKRIKMAKRSDRKTIDKVFVLLGVVTTVMLLAAGAIAWRGYTFATDSRLIMATRPKLTQMGLLDAT
jgi:hypothetical protein